MREKIVLPGAVLGFSEDPHPTTQNPPPHFRLGEDARAPFRDATDEIMAAIQGKKNPAQAAGLIEQNFYNPCRLIPQLEASEEWAMLAFVAMKCQSPVAKAEVVRRLLEAYLASRSPALQQQLHFLGAKGSHHVRLQLQRTLGASSATAGLEGYLALALELNLASSLSALGESMAFYTHWRPKDLPLLHHFIRGKYGTPQAFVFLFQTVLGGPGGEQLLWGIETHLLPYMADNFRPDDPEVVATLAGMEMAIPWNPSTTQHHLSLLRHPHAGPVIASRWNTTTLTHLLTHVGSVAELEEFCSLVPRTLEISLSVPEAVTSTNGLFSIPRGHDLGKLSQAGILFLLNQSSKK